jgi:hypothetical protein
MLYLTRVRVFVLLAVPEGKSDELIKKFVSPTGPVPFERIPIVGAALVFVIEPVIAKAGKEAVAAANNKDRETNFLFIFFLNKFGLKLLQEWG